MPRFTKGSPEALEWAKKMREARGKKKMTTTGEGVGSSRMLNRDVFREVVSNLSREELTSLLEDTSLTAEQRSIISEVMPPLPAPPATPKVSRRKKIGKGVAPPSRLPESSPAAEMAGGKLKIGKAFSKGIKAINKANPIMLAIKDKKTRGAMTTSGDIAYNYALPAVVEVGKPALDAAAMAASTAVTGNPLAGKLLVDTLWDKMVVEKGYDPRQRQRSQLLGDVSKEAGKVAGQETRAKLGKGMGSLTEAPSRGRGRYRTLAGEGMCMECSHCQGMGIVSGGVIGMRNMPEDVFRSMLENLDAEDAYELILSGVLTAGQQTVLNNYIRDRGWRLINDIDDNTFRGLLENLQLVELMNLRDSRILNKQKKQLVIDEIQRRSYRSPSPPPERDTWTPPPPPSKKPRTGRTTQITPISLFGEGMGASKPRGKVSPTIVPPARPMPKLGRSGSLPKMSAEEKRTYDQMIDQLMEFDMADLEESLQGEIERFNNRASGSGWGHPYDVGMFIALLKSIDNKKKGK